MEGMKRPEAIVLPDSSLIPSDCVISPPPNQFTHEVAGSQPFYAAPSEPPIGQFEAGAKVVLLYHDGGELCRVVDAAGRYVGTRFDGLRKI
ncbi:hypothetical protein PMI42_02452 [Bradyrhizobium sp. YR681]|uniref:hypothetical protein n=1 Tax=Bradyrhizobium sp. YR681 TaxID=1144344 RepID=UPI0002714895|nr:hypothetical protein [Bradyrhizobium sp. YR681]EJN13986.1 hypothetical protein PMI42_02452 [Bradyrhizobium sp. YR681]